MRRIVARIDLGGTAINYTLLDAHSGEFLVPGLAEHPARAQEGADVCLTQIAEGLTRTAGTYGVDPQTILAIGLDSGKTPCASTRFRTPRYDAGSAY